MGREEANLDERRALLEKLMDREPASTEGVMACLRVARALIEPDEFPEAHRLLSWAVRGLG